MDAALLGLSEVAPGIADSFASTTSVANAVLIAAWHKKRGGALNVSSSNH